MADLPAGGRIAVSGLGVVTARAVSAPALAALDPSDVAVSSGDAWFDPTRYFGAKGHKYLTPATCYVLAASQNALAHCGADDRVSDVERGVAIGTNFADGPVREQLDRTVLAEGAAGLSPAYAANSSVNIPASNISIRFGCRAFNVTITDPIVAGVEAVLAGCRAIEDGRAELVLAGATEGAPPQAALRFCGLDRGASGAAVLALERESRAPSALGIIVGGASRFAPPGTLEDAGRRSRLVAAVARDVSSLFERDRSHEVARPVAIARVPAGSALSRFVADAAAAALGSMGLEVSAVRFEGEDGAYMSVSPVLQLAAMLERKLEGIIVATSPLGHVAILRVAQCNPESARPGH